MGKLEDAVMVLTVADTVRDAGLVPLNRIGKSDSGVRGQFCGQLAYHFFPPPGDDPGG
jgi:hypothetical protein